MTLLLDARQRAMLEEMGVKVWLPQPPADTAEVAAPATARHRVEAVEPAPESGPQAGRAPVEAPPAPSHPAATPSGAAPSRSAPTAPAAPTAPTAPAVTAAASLFVTAPQRLYASDAQSATGGWLVVVDMPPHADGRHDGLLEGEAGRLLDQMLRALRLPAGAAPVQAMRLWRASPGQPSAEGALDFDAAFTSAVAPLAPQLVLALGPLAAQRLLGQQAPLGRLRGSVHSAPVADADCAVVASYHPAYLLRNGDHKGRAWADLCLAAEHIDRATQPAR